MSSKNPIGIFDSGVGGLTVLDKIAATLPEYDYLYLGDNARTPYGTRSFDTVYNYTLEGVEYLFSQGAQLVILACNTASAKALRTIQQNDLARLGADRRVLGVIRPSAEIVNTFTLAKHVGILGTKGTVKSESYLLEIQKLYPEIRVTQEACPMLVPLVEQAEYDTEGGRYFIRKYLSQLLAKDPQIDTIVLGCTHYPILAKIIREMVPQNVQILEQGTIVANSLKDYLQRHPEMASKCSKFGSQQFLTTGDPDFFAEKAEVILGRNIEAQRIVL